MIHRTLHIILGLLLTAGGGCLSTHVGDPEASVMDPKLVGVWHNASAHGDEDLYFVELLDKRTCLVQWLHFEMKDGKLVKPNDTLTLHGWLTDLDGKRFISLKLFSPGMLLASKDEAAKRYVVARLTPADNTLRVRQVNGNFAPARDAKTPADLEKVIAAHAATDDLYDGESTLTRVDPADPGPAKMLLDLMRPPEPK